jgi:hypothetical protein
MKEPGQIAYEAGLAHYRISSTWGELPRDKRAEFAAVEAAVRADERERLAQFVSDYDLDDPAISGRGVIAAAIRNLGETP